MPLREIRKRFTFSEMALMSWRSREMSANMARGRPIAEATEAVRTTTKELPDYGLQHQRQSNPSHVIEHEDSYELPKEINNGVKLPKLLFNKEGDLDLSKVTGPQAVMYLNALGLKIPTVMR
jgi:hypothetical protein